MRNLSRRGVERPGRSPEARGAAAAVCRAAALRYARRLQRGEGGSVDEGCRHQSDRRRHHRDFRIRRLTASAVTIARWRALVHGGGTFYTSALLRVYWLETISQFGPPGSPAGHGDVALAGGGGPQILWPADHLQR